MDGYRSLKKSNEVAQVGNDGFFSARIGVMDAIEESDCDSATVNRVVEDKEVPGALWHVYSAKDADKIRDLLNKVYHQF